MKIEFHILQNFPPSNLNRDDSGAPKDCDFGGYRRQRISSQCLKRSVRIADNFQTQLAGRIGLRTKKAPMKVTQGLVDLGYEKSEAKAMSEAFFDTLYRIKDSGTTEYLLFIGPDELERVVKALDDNKEEALENALKLREDDKDAGAKKYFTELTKRFKKDYPKYVKAIDIGLFGRMLANNPSENIDAGCQVAHAISVNRMNMEFDYFTAVDDISEADNSGAGMIGTVGFASSCFYRFAVVDMDLLSKNLGGDAASAQEGLLAFAEAFIHARPSGKQNTFAAHSLPSFIMVVARDKGQPVSLANAFEVPAKPYQEKSLTEDAIEKLINHFSALKKMYGLNGVANFVALDDSIPSLTVLKEAGIENIDNVPALMKKLEENVSSKSVAV